MFVASEWHKPDLSNTLILSASANLTAGKNGRCHHVLEKEIKGGREVNKKEKSQPTVYPQNCIYQKLLGAWNAPLIIVVFYALLVAFSWGVEGGWWGETNTQNNLGFIFQDKTYKKEKNKTEEAVSLRPRCVLWLSNKWHAQFGGESTYYKKPLLGPRQPVHRGPKTDWKSD